MADNGIPGNLIETNRLPKKTSFSIDVAKLASGTTIAQALSVLASPFLTRLYDPSTFGILALFTSIITIISVISCLRYEIAIMLPESNEEAGNLMVGSILISVIISLLTVPIVLLGNTSITRILNAPELGPYLWLIPPTILLGGTAVGHPAINYWTTRNKHFGWLSFARILGSVTTISFQLIAGYIGHATGGNLILASVFGGGIVSTLVLGWQVWKYDGKFLIKSFNWKKIYQGLKRYYKFPLFDSWSSLLNTTSWQLPAFFLTAFFSSTVTGFYALGNRVLRVPLNWISSAIAQVFYQRAAEAKVNGTLAQVVEGVFYYLIILSMFPLLLMTIVGKDLFVVIFGNTWSEAGVYAQILSAWTFFWFISSPMSTLFSLLEKQEFLLSLNIVIIITRIISLLIGGLLGSPRIALILFASSGIIVYGYLSIAIMRASGVPLSRVFRILFNNMLIILPVGAIFIIFELFGLNSWLIVGLFIITTGIYYLYVIKSDAQILRIINKFLHSRGLPEIRNSN
jgi:O-antigen/teichoic acid export membrane protein